MKKSFIFTDNLVSYVAIETVMINVIGGFGAEFLTSLAHRTV